MIGLLGMLACTVMPSEVTMTGILYDAPYHEGNPVSGEPMRSMDVEFSELSSIQTEEAGGFALQVPAGGDFFVWMEGEGHRPASFSGSSGLVDFQTADGSAWRPEDSFTAEKLAPFSDCASSADPGAVAYGEVRIYLQGLDPSQMAFANDATVKITGSDNIALQTCYLDDEGAYLESASSVGATGQFAIFGIPEGPVVVGVYSEGAADEALYRGYALADGVLPYFPLLVQISG